MAKLTEEQRIEWTAENREKLLDMLTAASGNLGYCQSKQSEIVAMQEDTSPDRMLWWVSTKSGNEDRNVVAITGDGPTSEANACLIANSKCIILTLLDRIDTLETIIRNAAHPAADPKKLGAQADCG